MNETIPAAVAEGEPFSEASFWSRFRNTPWRDLCRGRLSAALDHRPIVAAAELPTPLKSLVDAVVTRTRLWPRERRSVARELCDHFSDGLAAGNTVEQLRAEFGETATAARLIRRAKIRCRAWSWHVWHRGWQAVLGVGLLAAAIAAFLTFRFALATPTITFDIVEELDEQSRSIPVAERAWPLYAQGLVKIDKDDLTTGGGSRHNLIDAMLAGPEDSQWPAATALLAKLEPSIELFLAAAERPQLGFVNRDPDNEDWLRWTGRQDGWRSYNPRGTAGPSNLLSQTQDLHMVLRILRGALHQAIENQNGPRAVQLVDALLRLADHKRQTHDGLIADLSAFSTLSQASQALRELMHEQAALLSDADLLRLQQRVAATLGPGPITYRFDGDERMWQDYLQRAYTDDGDGNGRMTPEGLDLLRDFAFAHQALEWIEVVGQADDTATKDDWGTLISGAIVTSGVADRQQMQQKLDELLALQQEAWTDPETPVTESRYVQEMQRMIEEDPVKYLPLAAVYACSDWWQTAQPARTLIAVNLRREIMQVAIALEQYRRETGDWPATLQALVPQFLARVPADPYADGAWLRYRIVDGQPEVWSVGPNRQFDDFAPAPAGTASSRADQGDWQLIPTEELLY